MLKIGNTIILYPFLRGLLCLFLEIKANKINFLDKLDLFLVKQSSLFWGSNRLIIAFKNEK